MHVCVIGGGTIGSLVAGHMGRVCDVQVLTRRQEVLAEVKALGERKRGLVTDDEFRELANGR